MSYRGHIRERWLGVGDKYGKVCKYRNKDPVPALRGGLPCDATWAALCLNTP